MREKKAFLILVAHPMWHTGSLLLWEKLSILHLFGKTLVRHTKKVSREVLFIVVTLKPSNVVFLLKKKRVLSYLHIFVIEKCWSDFFGRTLTEMVWSKLTNSYKVFFLRGTVSRKIWLTVNVCQILQLSEQKLFIAAACSNFLYLNSSKKSEMRFEESQEGKGWKVRVRKNLRGVRWESPVSMSPCFCDYLNRESSGSSRCRSAVRSGFLFVYFCLLKRLSGWAFVSLADVQRCSFCFGVVAQSNKLFCHL